MVGPTGETLQLIEKGGGTIPIHGGNGEGIGVGRAGPLICGEDGGKDGGAGFYLPHQIAEGVQSAALRDGHALFR